ncbi:MAG TPA: terminase small subunit, partial [Gemmataceae bacterium]|nr:terminase small subunit [Gemmataceae bacterium]
MNENATAVLDLPSAEHLHTPHPSCEGREGNTRRMAQEETKETSTPARHAPLSHADRSKDDLLAASKGPRALTPMQRRFIEYYVMDMNATQAAIRAGYSAKFARKYAHALLNNERIDREL